MWSLRERTRPAYSGTSAGSAPSAATTTWRARTLPRSVDHRSLIRRGHRPAHRRALADARAGLLGGARQEPVPARRVERAVVIGQAAHEAGAPQRGRQLVALHDLAREAVVGQGARVIADVLGLLLGHRQPQQADLPERVARAQLRGQLVDVPLRLERARVHRAGSLGSVVLARVVVEGGGAGDQEAAVSPARAAGHGPGLEEHRLDAALREPAGAGEPAHAAADHARLDLHVTLERGARLVGSVQPEGGGAGIDSGRIIRRWLTRRSSRA